MNARVLSLASIAACAALAAFAPGPLSAQENFEAEILGHHGSPPRHLRLVSRDLDVELMENGQRFGYPVIFLHDLGDSWVSFARVLPALPLEIRAYYYSQRGHGGSDQPACCYKQEDFAADLLALMDAKGIQKATLVGQGMGSFTARKVALEHPERVDALVLIGSAEKAGSTAITELDAAVQALGELTPEFVRGYQLGNVCNPIGDAFLDRIVGESLKAPLHVWQDALHELTLEDHSEALATLAIPTLVVGGMNDSFFPATDQLVLATKIPSAGLALYADVCHAPQWEDAITFAEDLVQFLRHEVWID